MALGLKHNVDYYEGDPKVAEIKPTELPTRQDLDLEKDAIAIYQVADDLYMSRHYHLDP